MLKWLRRLKHPFAICYEESCGYGYLHDALREIAARVVVAYIDNPQRFRRTHQVGAYFGLMPRQDASAGSNRLGHIT